MYEYDLEDGLPSRHNRRQSIESRLDELDDIEIAPVSAKQVQSYDSGFLPSSMFESKKKKKKTDDIMEDSDAWFNQLVSESNIDFRKGKNSRIGDLFNDTEFSKKKKKKKKNEGEELTDFNKEFEPYMALYTNLLRDQNRFTESLQKEYDAINSKKSSARGTNKTINDLIENINGARQLSMQLVEKNVNTKKMIAELAMKEKKEKGIGALDGSDLNDYASIFAKRMISEKSNFTDGTSDVGIGEYEEDDIDSLLNGMETDSNRADEVSSYLKYENMLKDGKLQVYARVDEHDFSKYEFVAIDNEGNELDDYPTPSRSSLSVNKSTMKATDEYGEQYEVIWK